MTLAYRTLLLTALVAYGLAMHAVPARADCAADLAAIQAAIDSGQVDASLKQNAETMWAEAKKLHDAGQEAECTQMTAQIKASLGINE